MRFCITLRSAILLCFSAKLLITHLVVSIATEEGIEKLLENHVGEGFAVAVNQNVGRNLQANTSGCNPKWYGDKQCDVINCKAECDWDGGDCHENQCLAYISGKISPNANSNSSRHNTDGNTSGRYTGKNGDDYYYYDDDYYNDKAPILPSTGRPVLQPTKAPVYPPTKVPVSQVSPQDVVVDKALCSSNGGNPVLINDGKCDKFNRIPECGYDGNDCPLAHCRRAGGKPRYINDGTCDKFNNIAECNYDGDDCQNVSNPNGQLSPVNTPYSSANDSKTLCSNAGGKPQNINDGTCDKFNDIPECNFDGKDCQFKFPSKNVDPSLPAQNDGDALCSNAGGKPQYINDGKCDKFNAIAACNFDGKDCQFKFPSKNVDPSTPAQNDGNALCSNAGGKPQYINDGTCDKFNDIPECNFDGKDCQFKFPSKKVDPSPPAQDTKNPGGSSSVNDGDIGQYWTDLHNDVRRYYQGKYGYTFVNVVWSDELAQSSKSYADVLASKPCDQYDHDPNNPYGENLAVMWEANDSAKEKSRVKRVMDAWTYDEEIKPATLPYQEGSGHWTQVIWRATKYVGCGHTYRATEGCHVYVCRYITPGNCARSNNNWLADTMQETTRCEPQCPPSEGCFWKQTS